MVDLGKIGIRNRGEHVDGNQYEINDIVKSEGIVYFCLKDTSDAPTTENTEYWQVWSREAIEMQGATSTEDGIGGLVPKPLKGDEKKALLGDGTWGDVTIDVDDELSDTSENPVQNKVVDAEFKKVKSSIADTKDSKVTFESNDTLAPTELSDMPSLLKSVETHASLFSKISTVFRNMRYIIGLLGSTDISKETLGIGDSTVTGAIKGLNESLSIKKYTSSEILQMISITDGYTISNINIIRQGNLVHFDCSIKGDFPKSGRQLPIKILSTEILPYNRVDAVANGSNDAVTKLYPIGIVFSTSGMVFTYITDPGIDETIVMVMLSITYSVN